MASWRTLKNNFRAFDLKSKVVWSVRILLSNNVDVSGPMPMTVFQILFLYEFLKFTGYDLVTQFKEIDMKLILVIQFKEIDMKLSQKLIIKKDFWTPLPCLTISR